MGESENRNTGNPQKVRLPFEKRRTDWGAWVYNHRTALSITVIVYLLTAIAFMSAKIVLRTDSPSETIAVDFTDLEKLQEQLREAQELNRLLNEQAAGTESEVRNRYSNENAALDENLRDDRGTAARELYEKAEEAQRRLQASRELYEEGLARSVASRPETADSDSRQAESTKAEGNVTVSYSLSAPVRTAVFLSVPAYRCRGEGRVVVNITVDRSGEVTAAEIDKARSSSDYCMTAAATEAALASRFNADASAPQKQKGTVSYIFVRQ